MQVESSFKDLISKIQIWKRILISPTDSKVAVF
jgi:hypothetical protein